MEDQKKELEPLKWHTEKRRVKDLIFFEGNPRKMSQKQVEDLKKSLEKFNLVEIPAIDTDNKIIAGHQRLKILMLLGRGDEEVDVRVPNRKLTEEEFKEYNLRSNKNTGDWDFDLLANFDKNLLQEVGFESGELDKIFQLNIDEEEFDEEEEMKKIKQSSVKLGDLYQLGDHRLLCGDATKKEDIEKLMAGEKADMVFTDPPYGINIVKVNGKTKFGKVGISNWVSANYYLPVKGDDKEFNPQFLLNLSKKVLIFGGNYFANKLPNSKCWLVWDKTGDDYIQNNYADCELIWTNLDKPSRIYRCKWRGILKDKGEDIRKRVHPTQKPIKLLVDILRDYSRSGDIILDLFGGSGSILIACEQLKRKCRIMEIEPIYCEVIINRWEKFTGKKVIKLN